jgi:hypothetical protein
MPYRFLDRNKCSDEVGYRRQCISYLLPQEPQIPNRSTDYKALLKLPDSDSFIHLIHSKKIALHYISYNVQ